MRYSVFYTQLHHDSRQAYRNLDVSCTIDEILGLAKCLVWRKLRREVTKRGVSKMSAGVVVEFGPLGSGLYTGFSLVVSDIYCRI